jgi:hypothetical protein
MGTLVRAGLMNGNHPCRSPDRSRDRKGPDEITKRWVERRTVVCRQLAQGFNSSGGGGDRELGREREAWKEQRGGKQRRAACSGRGPQTDLENRGLTEEALSEKGHPAIAGL